MMQQQQQQRGNQGSQSSDEDFNMLTKERLQQQNNSVDNHSNIKGSTVISQTRQGVVEGASIDTGQVVEGQLIEFSDSEMTVNHQNASQNNQSFQRADMMKDNAKPHKKVNL